MSNTYKHFLEDLEKNKQYEIQAAKLVKETFHTETALNTDSATYKYWDFVDSVGTTYEVKADKRSLTTPNFYIEYESFNSPSGISITKADYYVITNTLLYFLIPTEQIRILIETLKPRSASCSNGRGFSRGYLIPQEEMLKYSISLSA